MSVPIDLDHVALASSDVQPHLDMLVAELGARVLQGGVAVGFRAMQVALGEMTVELIEPWAAEQNDFMVRFLERHGPGPHHLTFKVADLGAQIERLRRLGYAPVQIDMTNPFWMECFLTPDIAHGTVVQLAQSGLDDPAVMAGLDPAELPWPRFWWDAPPAAAADPVALRAVVITSPDPAGTQRFFADVLGGTPAGSAEAAVTWPGGGRIELEPGAGRGGIDRLIIDKGSARVISGARFVPAG